MNIELKIIQQVMKNFAGVKRRFSHVGKLNGVEVIDDYAHHPTEIKAVLSAAKQYVHGKIVVVHQPHRSKRFNSLFSEFCRCFDQADTVILTPIYLASDNLPLKSSDLAQSLRQDGKLVFLAESQEHLKNILSRIIKEEKLGPNDLILFTGAGNISRWAKEIVNLDGLL